MRSLLGFTSTWVLLGAFLGRVRKPRASALGAVVLGARDALLPGSHRSSETKSPSGLDRLRLPKWWFINGDEPKTVFGV